MRSWSVSSGAVVSKVTDTPDAVAPNGLTRGTNHVIEGKRHDPHLQLRQRRGLEAQRQEGHILSRRFGAYHAPRHKCDHSGRGKWHQALETVLVFQPVLHDTNQGLMCRVPISTTGMATGSVEVLATRLMPDDFDLDREGRPWTAQNTANVVSVLLKNGTVVTVAGAKDQTTIAGATSCIFWFHGGGIGSQSDLLHCTTTGGIAAPVNGTIVVGWKVVIIHTKGF
ncbi:unnamed protein product [Calypogeia fissa]